MQLLGVQDEIIFLSERDRKKYIFLSLNGKIFHILRLVLKFANMSHLTLEQRYIIQTLKDEGFKQNEISKRIGKDKSVISRELKRNSDQRNGKYRAELAQKKCDTRHKTKKKHIRFTADIQKFVTEQTNHNLSPEQITGRAKQLKKKCIPHECIYQFIWEDKKKDGVLYKHLKTKGKCYRKRDIKKDSRGIMPDRISIEQRPEIVDKKIRIGDLEADLVIGMNHKRAILTINDRASGMSKLSLLESKSSEELKIKMIDSLIQWKPLIFTITSDNGKEFAQHKEISKQLEINFFFARPYHSWERGANENLNGLLRQYFPKKFDLKQISEKELQEVENKLNNRPRKRFGFLTPNEVFLHALNNDGKVAFIT